MVKWSTGCGVCFWTTMAVRASPWAYLLFPSPSPQVEPCLRPLLCYTASAPQSSHASPTGLTGREGHCTNIVQIYGTTHSIAYCIILLSLYNLLTV